MPTWFTVDSDDLRHLPKHQGHPTRSRTAYEGPVLEPSEDFVQGWKGLMGWMDAHEGAVTLFVITDLLESEAFPSMLSDALTRFPQRLTVGCHGHTHRSWSAWGEDVDGFSAMLERSTALLKQHAGDAFRPYFRAPNGYVAPWMGDVLARHGYRVDSSVNPSWLVRNKAAGHRWSSVASAMKRAGVVERAWLTRWTLPVNGPALVRPPLSILARRAWKKAPKPMSANGMHGVDDPRVELTTVYCHVLDFARKNGTWVPPLPTNRAK
jgi:hypothetical protein